ncbi:uncharacterized protein [Porites lutea]|uniref:uncharacterized protein n=1 Tax=Porites lutea TaxID=51062 RepID=UPI003CC672C7
MPYILFPGFCPPRHVSHHCHISALELFTVIVAVKFWATALQHQRFLVSCDNEAAVTVINSGSTKDPFMQRWNSTNVSSLDAFAQRLVHLAFAASTRVLPLHAAMWALFLVAFFTFLRKSNLVSDVADRISTKVPLRPDLEFSSQGASLHIKASKTIQYQQRSLSIPLPCIPGSQLCPVGALRRHLRLNPGPSHAPLFSVFSPTSRSLLPITYRHFSQFVSRVIQAIGLVPVHYSPHSFRCGGASFAFRCNVPAELIQWQGDWQSDAYLVYLEMSSAQKRQAVNSMAAQILLLSRSSH